MVTVGARGWVWAAALAAAGPAAAAPLVDVLSNPAGPSAPTAVLPTDEATVAALLRNPGERTLVVNFFATWCGSCAAELDALQTVVAANPGVRGVLVSLDSISDGPRLARFVAEHRVSWPVVHLQSTNPGATMLRLVPGWPERIPVTVVLAPGGEEQARFVGAVSAPQLASALARPPG